MDCVEYQLTTLKHSLGDVIEALRESTWYDKHYEKLHMAYLFSPKTPQEQVTANAALGAVVRQMMDEELNNMAERMCDE